jgi:3-oxoacyl-(acyl-carrier-protein) synthase
MRASTTSDSARRVVVTGLGLVSPLGLDLPSAWTALRDGTSSPVAHEHRLGDEVWGTFPLFRVDGFDARRLPLPDEARSYAETHALWDDADLMFLVGALTAALADAGLDDARGARDVGLVLTHENPGVDRHVDSLLESFHQARGGPLPSRLAAAERLYDMHHDDVYHMQSFMMLHRVARLLGLHGQALFVNNACASGLYALDAAALLLRAGRCRAVLVAGADHPVSFTKYRWFSELGLMAADGVMKPFDARRHGFVLGDGGSALVLEHPDAARARGLQPYAEYRGGGFNQEAWKVALPDPASMHYEACLRAALAESGIAARDVDWLVPHGVATSVTDAYEARTLNAVFGPEFERPRLSAFKPYVGHNLGGSGTTEIALLLLAMRNGLLPPARGCETPDPALRLRPLREPAREIPRLAMKCAAGFGGFNAAGVFERLE